MIFTLRDKKVYTMKRVFSAFIFLIGAYAASAQNVSLGPSVGVAHSWITGMDNVKFRPGVSVGGVLTWSPAPHWGLGGDIRVAFMEGVKMNPIATDMLAADRIHATYLRVPLKATYFFGDFGDKVRPKVYAGPSFGFLLGGETKYPNSTLTTKSDKVLQGFDWGLIAGAGFNYRIKPNTWFNFDLAYTNGLKDVTEAAGYHANRNITLNLGVTFPLGTAR
jgi:hypothetical protein